jgi:hypothetical protein
LPAPALTHDRYRLTRQLASGGMGTVYVGLDVETGAEVAIKVALEERHAAQFEVEARLLSALAHPAVVRVRDYFEADGGCYLVMDLVDGEDLAALVERRGTPGLPLTDALDYVRQAGEALHYVHEQQVLHLDVKPRNLIAGSEGIVLVDFGLAIRREHGEAVARMGTRHFMAPEVFVGSCASPRSDVFGLAATLWNLLAGKPPVYSDPTRLAATVPGVSSELEATIRTGLEMLPDRRFASVEAFARVLGAPLLRTEGRSLARSVPHPSLPSRLLEAVVRTAAATFEAAAASIALVDDMTDELVYRAAWGAGAREIVGVRLPPATGLAGAVVSAREGVVIADCRTDPRFQAAIAARTGYVPHTMVVVPLESARARGVLSILDRRSGLPYTAEDLPRAQLFADLAVAAIEAVGPA